MAEDQQGTELPIEQVNTESTDKQEQESKPQTLQLTQSELDRIKGEAIFKALDNERKEQETKRLKEKGQWDEVSSRLQQELDSLKSEKARAEFNSQVMQMISEKNLQEYKDILMQLPDIKSVSKAVDVLQEKINLHIERQVNERLTTKSPINSTKVNPSKPWESTETWAEFRKQKDSNGYI